MKFDIGIKFKLEIDDFVISSDVYNKLSQTLYSLVNYEFLGSDKVFFYLQDALGDIKLLDIDSELTSMEE